MKKSAVITILGLVALGAVIIFVIKQGGNEKGENLDAFAQCLSQKGVAMYGSANCPHCQNEKNRFGEAFRYINYVECLSEPRRCVDQGINSVPTWLLANGQKLVGEQGLEKLAQASGCPLK